MGCCGSDREKWGQLKNDVKWEYVDFENFKSHSCWTYFAYIYLWIMLCVSISVYAVDTFTAINLLAFNRWSGQIKPWLDFKYLKWIFAGCIILSFVLLIYRWLRALKVMSDGTVARSYLDPLAVRVQCIRSGENGRGWKRFLVFAELTKSRKGADYVALFAYYSFEAWLRICFAEGPRQVCNALTLYSVLNAKLIPEGDHATPQGQSSVVQFFKNIGLLADENKLQAVILFGMLWTLFIWVISAICLLLSVVLYLLFLWHHIPSDVGGLTGYCRGKINRRMQRIVKTKTDEALQKENELRVRQEAKAFREGGSDVKRQPTLPDLGSSGTPSLTPLSRTTTMTTLPEYTSRPGTAHQGEDYLPPMPTPGEGSFRPAPRRHMTSASDASWSSYNSNAPLINTAGDMGYSLADRSHTPVSAVSTPWSARSGPGSRFTGVSEFSDRSYTPGPPRPPTAQSGRNTPGTYQLEPISRPGTSLSNGGRQMRISAESDTLPPMPRGQTPLSATSSRAPLWSDGQGRRTAAPMDNPYFPPISPAPENHGRDSPALRSQIPQLPPIRPFSPQGPPSRSMTPRLPPIRPFSPQGPPSRSMTPQSIPARSMTPGSGMIGVGQPVTQSRIQTPSSTNHTDYVPFNPSRTNTPGPSAGGEPLHNSIRPYGAQTPNHNGSVDDILNHY